MGNTTNILLEISIIVKSTKFLLNQPLKHFHAYPFISITLYHLVNGHLLYLEPLVVLETLAVGVVHDAGEEFIFVEGGEYFTDLVHVHAVEHFQEFFLC